MDGNPLKSVTSLPPKTIAIIVVVGVGGGLFLRKFRGGSGIGSGSATTPAVNPNDLALSGLASSSTGNLGVGGTGDGGSTPAGSRDVGTITLPVVKWVVTIGDQQYLTDGTSLEPLNSGAANPPVGADMHDPNGVPNNLPDDMPMPTTADDYNKLILAPHP